MNARERDLLSEIESDLESPNPQVQLGLGENSNPTISDATAALTKTLSFLAQLPISEVQREDLIRKTQEAYQQYLHQHSGATGPSPSGRPATKAPEFSTQPTNTQSFLNYAKQFSASKTLLSVLIGIGMAIWSATRSIHLQAESVSLPVAALAIITSWFVVSLFEFAWMESKYKSGAKSNWGIVGAVTVLAITTVIYQAISCGAYLSWFSRSSSDAFERIVNSGGYESTESVWIPLLIATALNLALCISIDKLMKVGQAKAGVRIAVFGLLFLAAPILTAIISVNLFGDSPDPQIESSLIVLAPFFVAPLLATKWAEKKELVGRAMFQVVFTVSATAMAIMLIGLAKNPYTELKTPSSRLPEAKYLSVKSVGEYLFYLSSYNALGGSTPEKEAAMDQALKEFISNLSEEELDQGMRDRWPEGLDSEIRKDMERGESSRTYRPTAITILNDPNPWRGH